ncbi:helix-turn-helix transcriptional regulator [Halonotius roseus]|uniref:Helix-turn-helix domain-containing protein n=1 Tax=Halonotius roseus TaxID=2511997 RepID=A0A544QRA6_9EURY|nr:hypothetical protein [Halonotius roseus]TQQ81976.1 hypothetical protein EWF95_03290 [Halonotius roseus]
MRFVALGVVFLVCLAVAPPTAVAAVSPDTASPASIDAAADSTAAQPIAQTTPPDGSALAAAGVAEPTTTFEVALQPDRSADWTVTVVYDLQTDDQQTAFDELAAAYQNGEADFGPTAALYENLAARASEATDREMAVENPSYDAVRRGTTGRLELSFTWTNFLADAGDEQLVFNDALSTPGGTWLSTLEDDQVLRITTPRGYAITSANVPFADNTVEIEGPRTFSANDHIRISFEESVFGAGALRFVGVAVILAAMIIGVAVLLRRNDSIAVRERVLPGDGDDDSATAAPTAPTEEPAEPDSPEEDLSLLADDERVERLLERNGGRMRQAAIVEKTNWSDAKVSQLLSSMAAEDRVSKLRIGRENLITLPGVDATGNDDQSGGDDQASGGDGQPGDEQSGDAADDTSAADDSDPQS